jgi:predicted TIM-barrel fold metal-dependent hydrolase
MVDANPILMDDVALMFPDLKIIIAHMGHPWVHECAVVMRRHANVYTDLSAIARRPMILATALAAAKEYGVFNKLLLGSDFPVLTTEETMNAIRSASRFMQNSWPTKVSDDEVEAIFDRDTFSLLHITAN